MRRPNDSAREEIPKAKINLDSLKEARSIFKYVKPYRGHFNLMLLFIALSAFTTMSIPYLLNLMVFSIDHAVRMPKLVNAGGHWRFINNGIQLGPGIIALIMVGILGIQLFFSYMRIYLSTYVGENAMADMRKDIYKKMIMMPMEFFAQRRVGELTTRISADVSQIQDMVSSSFAELLRASLTLTIGLIAILLFSVKLTLVMLSVVPVMVVVGVVFGKKIRKLSRSTQDMLADSGTIVQETLQGITNVKSFSSEWFEMKRYGFSLVKMVAQAIKSAKSRGLFVSLLIFSIFSAVVLVVWYGTTLIGQGELTVLNMTTFVIYTAFVCGTLAGLADLFGQIQKSIGATQRVRELLVETSEDVAMDNLPLKPEYKLQGAVSFKHIAFSYPSRKEVTVLKDVSIDAEKGQKIAIVGPSGAGKSTIVALLLQFYNPDSGKIEFDGRPAETFPISELRKQMALVPQDVMLFGGTIMENIGYGKYNATREEVEEAAKKANAHDFIVSFPEGYDTIVGERGIKLSGGQRQRIAIARAILKDPVILLLDEATSSLDSESEFLVQEALTKLMVGRTSFVVAHRLSTIRNADKIIVLEDGMVVESGTHQELIGIDAGLYKNLSKLQLEYS